MPRLLLALALLLPTLLLPRMLAAAERVAVPDTMAQRALGCTACHGREGRSTPDGYFPRIAGKPTSYLFQQLRHFRDGRRQNAAMQRLLRDLPDDYLQALAGYFGALDLPYAPPERIAAAPAQLARGEALVRQGDAGRSLPACAACHGQALTGRQPAVPGLLGLPRDYLAAQLGGWRTGQRHAAAPDCMAQIAQRLNDADIAALATWLATQPAPADAKPVVPTAGGPMPMTCGSVTP